MMAGADRMDGSPAWRTPAPAGATKKNGRGQPNEPSGWVRGRHLLPTGALVFCALLVVMQLYVGIPIAPLVADDLDANGVAGALTTAFSLAYALGFVLFGPLSDHVGRKAVLVLGVSALALSTAAVSLAPSHAALAGLRALQGLSAASFPATAIAYLNEELPTQLRATAIGALSTAFLLAAIVGQVYASAVAHVLGWRWAFAFAAVAFALAAGLLGASLDNNRQTIRALSLGARFRQLPAHAGRPGLAPALVAGFALFLTFVAMYSALGPQLQEHIGLTSREVLLVRVAAVPAMLLAPLAGALSGRVGATSVAVAGLLGAGLGLVCATLASSSAWPLIGATELFVAGFATAVPALIVLVAGLTKDARGAGISLYSLAAFIGASLGPIVAGPPGFAYLLIALAAALAVAAGLLVASSRRTRHPAHRATAPRLGSAARAARLPQHRVVRGPRSKATFERR
jgi:MFS transporter, YNFM family, putative membrane transport protein